MWHHQNIKQNNDHSLATMLQRKKQIKKQTKSKTANNKLRLHATQLLSWNCFRCKTKTPSQQMTHETFSSLHRNTTQDSMPTTRWHLIAASQNWTATHHRSTNHHIRLRVITFVDGSSHSLTRHHIRTQVTTFVFTSPRCVPFWHRAISRLDTLRTCICHLQET